MKRTERIAALNQQIDALKQRTRRSEQILRNRRQRLENAERAKKRKLDTRYKILTGAAVIAAAKTNPILAKLLDQARDRHLTSPRDRALFGLPAIDKSRTPPAVSSTPSGSRDDPIPGFQPQLLGSHDWGSQYQGDTSKLPDDLNGLWIMVTDRKGQTGVTRITETLERTAHIVIVRDSGKPQPLDGDVRAP